MTMAQVLIENDREVTRPLRDDAYERGSMIHRGPWIEGIDVAGLILAVCITLGPLAAYAVGWGAGIS
jgi:hypothetical protein